MERCYLAGMLKKPGNKAAGEQTPQAYLFSPAQPRARLDGRFTRVGYVEDVCDPRTQLGKGRVSARPGLGG